MGKIKVAIAGVGNCASSLIQGVYYYQKITENDSLVPGLMHNVFAGYKVSDIEFVAAFDVDKRKVGKDLSEAIEGQEIAVSIDNGNIGKNLKENEVLYTYISLRDLIKLEQIKDYLDKDVYPVLEEIKKILRS